MYQDLAFEITPAKARKLLKVSELCLMDIDPLIQQIANQDLIEYPGITSIEKSLAQIIVDFDFRCGLINTQNKFKKQNILEILKFMNVEVIITGKNRALWDAWDHDKWNDEDDIIKDVEFLDVQYMLTSDVKKYRNHCVIYDWNMFEYDDNLEVIAKDFSKIIVYVSAKEYASYETIGNKFPWWRLGCALFPNIPKYIFEKSKYYTTKTIMHDPIWKKFDLNEMAILYNMFYINGE